MMENPDQTWFQAVQLHLHVLELRAMLDRAVASFSPEGNPTMTAAPPPQGNEDWMSAYA